jgi:hypothetical protein
VAGSVGFIVVGAFDGVEPEQVVQREPVWLGGVHQVGGQQDLGGGGRILGGCPGQRRDGGQADRGQPGEPDEPEDAGRVGMGLGKGVVADLEAGPDGQVAGGQLGQPPSFAGQQPTHLSSGPGGARRQPAAGDADGQRQSGAGLKDALGAVGVGFGALAADDGCEQRPGISVVEAIEADVGRAVQVGQRGAAGDDDRAGGGSRQQRPDLGRVARVVEHDQHAADREQRAIVRRAFCVVGRDRGIGNAEVAQEPGENLGRLQRVA